MYCVKVNPGTERIRVRNYTNGFLPSYRSVGPDGRIEGKRFVVPGYIFMLSVAPGAEKVPDEEWKVIEALSDPHRTEVDPGTGTMTEGPLKAIEAYVQRITAGRAQVKARLLGAERQYWVPVHTPGEEKDAPAVKPAAEEKAGQDHEKDGNGTKNGKTKPELTAEEKDKMLARAGEIGIHAAAKEFGVSWQTLAFLRKRVQKAGDTAGKQAVAAGAAAPPAAADFSGSGAGVFRTLKEENLFLREKAAKLEAQAASLQQAIEELL